MEKQLKCVVLLSLKEISLRRVAVLLWSGPDTLASISKFSRGGYSGDNERQLVDKIRDKMMKLELPEILTKQLIELVGPMSLEARAWKYSQQLLIRDSSNAVGLPDSAKLCWTTTGNINYRKTAEELFRCDKLDVEQRYRLACEYCLEDRISLYWEELPKGKKDTFINCPLWDLTYCWPCILKGKHSELDHLARAYRRIPTSFNQFAFEFSAKGLNKTAAEYFFQKLSREEREASLMSTAHALMANRYTFPGILLSNVFLYLLSLMTLKQQIEIIKAQPIGIFLCFLGSQLQGLFRENAGLLWALFPSSSYIDLLEPILFDYPIISYPKVIKELFMESPQDFKTCFVDETPRFPETPADSFLCVFLRCNDFESIKVVFRNVDAAIRVKLVPRNLWHLYNYMLRSEWYFVKLCLREATLSKEAKRRVKDDFTELLENEERGASNSLVLKRFFEILDETDASYDTRQIGQKRKLENGSPE